VRASGRECERERGTRHVPSDIHVQCQYGCEDISAHTHTHTHTHMKIHPHKALHAQTFTAAEEEGDAEGREELNQDADVDAEDVLVEEGEVVEGGELPRDAVAPWVGWVGVVRCRRACEHRVGGGERAEKEPGSEVRGVRARSDTHARNRQHATTHACA